MGMCRGGALPGDRISSSSSLCCVVLCCAVSCCCAVLCCAVLCCVVLCCAVLFCVVLCCAVLCRVVLCCIVLCSAVLCCAVLCCVVLFCAVLFCVVLSCAVLCCVVLCCVVLCCVVLCCVVLCCAVLCCVVLRCVALCCVVLSCVVLCQRSHCSQPRFTRCCSVAMVLAGVYAQGPQRLTPSVQGADLLQAPALTDHSDLLGASMHSSLPDLHKVVFGGLLLLPAAVLALWTKRQSDGPAKGMEGMESASGLTAAQPRPSSHFVMMATGIDNGQEEGGDTEKAEAEVLLLPHPTPLNQACP